MRIADGRNAFVQWDTGQKIVFDAPCAAAHFAPRTGTVTIDVEARLENGEYVADVPDELLQTARPVTVYAFVQDAGRYTRQIRNFEVRARPKPADYIYTPSEKQTWEQFKEKLDAAVLFTEQSLTEDQQTQALENIRAVDKYNGLKRYDVEYQNSRGVTIKNTIYTNGVLTQPEELSTETEIGMAWARFNSWLGLTLSINPSSESYYIKAIAAIADFGCFGNDFWETTSDTSRIFTKTPEKLPDRYTCIYSYSADTKTIWAKKYYETSRYEVGYSIKTNKFTNYAIYFGTPIQPTAVKADAIPDVMQFQMKTDPTSDMQVATKKYVDDTAAQAGGGTDLSLSLTNATVGQIAKITAVDDDGAPTAWEAVDMPSGGGDETWELIGEATCAENAQVFMMDKDSDGNAFALKAVAVITYSPAFTGDTASTGRGMGVYPTASWGHGLALMNNAPTTKNGEIARYELHYFRLYGDSVRLIRRFASHNATSTRGALMPMNNAGDAPISFSLKNDDDPFELANTQFTGAATCVKICGYANTAISAGTKIKVWGMRA